MNRDFPVLPVEAATAVVVALAALAVLATTEEATVRVAEAGRSMSPTFVPLPLTVCSHGMQLVDLDD